MMGSGYSDVCRYFVETMRFLEGGKESSEA